MSAGVAVFGRRPLRGWLLAMLAVLAVLGHLYGLYRPASGSEPWFRHADKIQHLLGFAGPVALVLLAARSLGGGRAGRSRSPLVPVVVGLFGLNAAASELAQHYFYRYRTGDVADVLADALGIALGWWVVRLLSRSRAVPGVGTPLRAGSP